MRFLFLSIFLLLSVEGFSQKPNLILPIGHTIKINKARFSSDGKKIITGSFDGSAKLWDAEAGILIANLLGHTSAVQDVSFSDDGRKIITASFDGTARLWDSESGLQLTVFSANANKIQAACFSPDGKKIATSSSDGRVRIWDVNSKKKLIEVKAIDFISSIKFSPDGKKIASGSFNSSYRVDRGGAQLWDAVTGKEVAKLCIEKDGFCKAVADVQFSPDGKTVVTCTSEGPFIWDITTGELLNKMTTDSLKSQSADFDPEGTRLLVSAFSATQIWDVSKRKLLLTLDGFYEPTHEMIIADGLPYDKKSDKLKEYNKINKYVRPAKFTRRKDFIDKYP